MKKKKILIYFEKARLAPTGGPSGYLYNLYNGILECDRWLDSIEIDFLETETLSLIEKKKSKFKKIPFVGKFLHFLNKKRISNQKISDIFKRKNNYSKIDLNNYDIVHFHSCLEMFKARDSLKNYRGIVLLTSHTPKISHLEILDDLDNSVKKKYKKVLSKISIIDEYSFNNADYYVFPVQEALECYFNTWRMFGSIFEKNKERYRFIPTGIIPKTIKEEATVVRKKYGIPSDAFVVSYVGRHNQVKGYDSLKRVGEILLNEFNDVYFLVAGNEGPLHRFKHERWIEVGWTNDSASLIGASNVFILPNKETYFDLVMLEVLSLGKIVICSKTGGNKYFSKFDSSGILLYQNEQECIEYVRYLKGLTSAQIDELETKNKTLFDNNFTNEIFSLNYIRLYKDLLEQNKDDVSK